MAGSKRIGALDFPSFEEAELLAQSRDELARIALTAINKLAAVLESNDPIGRKALYQICRKEARENYRDYDARASATAPKVHVARHY